jgi:hypothetical protein
MIGIGDMNFPIEGGLADGFWQPVFFRFNFDTPERLVAAVVAFANGQWHLERANSLERLKCLYGSDALVALDIIKIGLDELQASFERIEQNNILGVTGLELGTKYDAQGRDASEIAQRWLRQTSSLHNQRRENHNPILGEVDTTAVFDALARDISKDRLSVLVMEQMVKVSPQSRGMFNSHVHKLEKHEGAKFLSHGAYVAFNGKKVAANFSTIRPGRNKISVDISKRLMWDLKQHRVQAHSLLDQQLHEMFLFHPKRDDPMISTKQFDNVMDVVETLRGEGENHNIKVVAQDSVVAISEALIAAEGLS